MVAYSFNSRFEEPILTGAKSRTIRAIGRRRHARAGETVQLYVGMRTRQCRLMGEAVCTSVDPIQLTVLNADISPTMGWIGIEGARLHYYRQVYQTPTALDDFALRDGFKDQSDMARFWADTHGGLIASDGVIRFRGLMIQWAPLGGPLHELD